ncbi:acyl-CoA dehydrogenase family protein [Xylophilus sp. GOD-11R]|uniref:acyl-CoA dehydrogenase family protein n=1 Tax=Xylophilus sp. GOD-11R TaxID=3089814 RepID=UPI00298C34B3|nr:acyl-CoA dehydrogenase family protein [Xylophilus sp. GOD-11R]WPB58042.1 acyl-CoA dehydrogenase family protein [Xylophilus sp. GOD-11R]
MIFEHTQDRRMLADTLARFIADRNPIEQRNRIAYGKPGFSEELWQGLAELGTTGALFPESAGGFGGAGFDISVVFEAIGRGLVVEPLLGSLMVGRMLLQAGGHAAALEAIVTGEQRAALAWEEVDARWDPQVVFTRASHEGGSWVLEGDKIVVRQAAAAGVLLVSARTSGEPGQPAGITLFLVPADAPGVALRTLGSIDGGTVSDVSLRHVVLDASAVVGPVDGGAPLLERGLGAGLLALCAESVGAMDVAKDATIDYLRTRKQFNLPIGSFQALQHRMATVLIEIEQARSAVINAAAAFDAEDRVERERVLSAAKMSVGRIGALVSEECIQLHGGIGMTWELPLSHYAKRLIAIDHELGDEDFHLERYIALGRGA